MPVDVITMKEAVQRVQNLYFEPGLHTVVTVNAEMVMRARHDKELHQILKQSQIWPSPTGPACYGLPSNWGSTFPNVWPVVIWR